jgi:pimeloyl-ACP methyl ester carboxylesterase
MSANKHESDGTAVPLLLVPGLMCDSRIFAGQLAGIPQAVPAAGFGEARTLPDMALRVLNAAPRRFALLGHSMGARVALELFRIAPERVERLALLSTGIHPVRPGEREKRYPLRDLGREKGMAALVDVWLPPMIGEAGSRDPVLVERLRAMCIDAGLTRFEAEIEALLSRPAVDSLLPRITVPTLVAVGSDDRWAPPEQHAAFAAQIPDARLAVIEGAGHMLPAEKPNEFNAAIAEWLAAPTAKQKIDSEETIDE